MTLEETLIADMEALKVVIACLVKMHPNHDALRAAAFAVLDRHETTLLYSSKLSDGQIHRVRETLSTLVA